MPPDDLMKATELLVTDIVKDARKKRTVTDGAGNSRSVPIDLADRVKAADAALRFLQVKNKLAPEREESDLERKLRELHGEGEGDGDSAEGDND